MSAFVKCVGICLITILSACSFKDVKKQIAVDWRVKKYSILAEKDLNDGYPVAIDLIFVEEQSVLDSLTKLRALEWFLDRKDYIRKYKSQLKIISYEIVPGQVIKNVDIPYAISGDAISLIVFADYFTQGSFSSTIKNKSEVIIKLRARDFEMTSSEDANRSEN